MELERQSDSVIQSISSVQSHQGNSLLLFHEISLETVYACICEGLIRYLCILLPDKDANDTVSLVSGKLNIGQGSTSQSYRPRIRYTKLNFKVNYRCYCSLMLLFFDMFIPSSHHFLILRLTHSLLLDPLWESSCRCGMFVLVLVCSI